MSAEIFEHNPDQLPSTEENRWRPVRKGDIYCSPACGGKCKFADYQHAFGAAKAMIDMLGAGWEPEIWENCGWHYRVSKGDVEVSFSANDAFTASIRINYIFDAYSGTISESSNDPREAVEKVTTRLNEIIARLTRTSASAALDSLSLPAAVAA